MRKKLFTMVLSVGLSLSLLCGCGTNSKKMVPTAEKSASSRVETESASQKNEYTQTSDKEHEALEVSKKDRKEFLFEESVPKKEKEMEKYLSPVALPSVDKDGKEVDAVMQVHEKLTDNFRGAFTELKKDGYLFQGDKIFIYDWRFKQDKIRSTHSYGCSVDLYMKGYDESDQKKVKEIMQTHGFGYVKALDVDERNEYMHFSYLNA